MRRLHISTLILALASIFVQAAADSPAEPVDLTKLRESWQRAINQANVPLNKKYEEALTAMKTRFTKEGKLQEALAVDKELKILASEGSLPELGDPVDKVTRLRHLKTTDEFAKWLAGSKWSTDSGTEITFGEDGQTLKVYDNVTTKTSDDYQIVYVRVGILEHQLKSGITAKYIFTDDLRSFENGNREFSKVDP